MNRSSIITNTFGGLQWLLFMFTNTVVIPLSIGAALGLSNGDIAASVQRAFIYTGIACLLQALFGHKLPIMEGQSGLWWGVILGLSASVPKSDSLNLGGSLAVGIIGSGVIIMLLGALGMGVMLKKWFTPVVMSAFLFLLAGQLILIFFKGMLGLAQFSHIHLSITALSIVLVILVNLLLLKGKGLVSNFALLIGIGVGWMAYVLLLPQVQAVHLSASSSLFQIFPWGWPAWNVGIILTGMLAGLINTTNTVATLKGSEAIFEATVNDAQYKRSFILTGLNAVISGLFGLVPYAPYTSSLGFLQSTRIKERLPFLIGSCLFIILGCTPILGHFFSTLPVSVGDAVLFVAYLQLFGSALKNLEELSFDYKSIYRIAAPTLVGFSLMALPTTAFEGIPMLVRPLLSNGLLVGILLALILNVGRGVKGLRREHSI
jgi:xanthine/uracil permease